MTLTEQLREICLPLGHRGRLGVRLDRAPDWTEIAELCTDAYRTVAPGPLVAELDRAGEADR